MGLLLPPSGIGIILLILYPVMTSGQVLTPPYFNLAAGRRITASASCGEETNEPELYCKLVGANADADANINLIQGQVCDYCEPGSHPANFAIDGSERWWQSPPLSRGNKYNGVNLTIDLGQEFHVAYVTITMANSPRPGVWVLERSSDNGQTYKPWQYFADTPGDCVNYFGKETSEQITRDDSVICDTRYSKVVPLEGGEIFIPLVKNRPSALDFFGSEVLQEWTRATNIRLRLLRTKTLLGHLMSVARQDPTVTRRYFYSIKDISIGGRCRCNGHADTCDITDPKDRYRLLCRCQHNTCGDQCERCCDGHVQKAWRISHENAPFLCEQCNCNGHSETCYYDEGVDKNRTSVDIYGRYDGGGVCTNCRDNTEGINCNKCSSGFYRPYGKVWNETDVCRRCRCNEFYHSGTCDEGSGRCQCRVNFQEPDCSRCSIGYYDYPTCKPCDCNVNGTRGELCHADGGQCPCKVNYRGLSCNECAPGFYNFDAGCLACECRKPGALSSICDTLTGQCDCDNKFGSRTCNACEDGYFDYANNCKYCNCDIRGTEQGICQKDTGQCLCRDGYGGSRCDQCIPGYFISNGECRPCNCSAVGSSSTVCDASGKCSCLENFSSRTCEQCKVGYYKFPECLSCNCTADGSLGVGCDDSGRCHCRPSFDGGKCSHCKEGYYNFPLCEECNCDPAGVIEGWDAAKGCKHAPAGELCHCKGRVQGRICNECKPLYWNLQHYLPQGCQDCDCNEIGILGGVKVCDGKTGQCPCKANVVSRSCAECTDGFYNLTANNILGCTGCHCDVGGSVHGICEKTTGKCVCRPRITGTTCTEPMKTHYIPSLYQFQYEAEDGISRTGGPARFGYDENLFPNYSWRGYAVYNDLQPETRHDVYVDKSSLYRLVLRYVNPLGHPIVGEVIAIPESSNDAEQKSKVRFEPNATLVTVSTGSIPAAFYFNPGRWQFTIKVNQFLMVDYFVLIPAAYYEASILQKRVTEPCLLDIDGAEAGANGRIGYIPNPCIKLQYTSLESFDKVNQDDSHIFKNNEKSRPRKFYTDSEVLSELNLSPNDQLAVLSSDQSELGFDFNVAKNGRFVLVISYFTPDGEGGREVKVESTSEKGKGMGRGVLAKCLHATICRQVVTTDKGEVGNFFLTQAGSSILLKADMKEGDLTAIESVTAIPLRRWVLDYIRPKEFCVFTDGACLHGSYEQPPDSIKLEAETDNIFRVLEDLQLPIGVIGKTLIKLDQNNRTVEINGKVPSPGYYKVIVHYFQPENPDFSAEVVLSNGQAHECRVRVVHCPSNAGCRSFVSLDDKTSRFYIDNEFSVEIKSPKSLYVDNIVMVPSPYENERELEKYVKQTPLDETRRFIAECGKNHMYLPAETEGFCRRAVFSLTTDYNNGALYCECISKGSTSFECAPFGGQCSCKPNIIGRKCERCKTGFYGFPTCKPCDCPSTAYCEPTSGQCICPPRVIDDEESGLKCAKCAPQSFGYHALVGCEECGCSTIGTAGNQQCDLMSGQCTCKDNVVGQKCSRCKDGHWAFPLCQVCHCDIRGTTSEICSQDTAACSCKQLVEGRGCDSCKSGSFNLQETNAQGCTKCFCFGKAQRCSSSGLFWRSSTIPKRNWTAVAWNPLVMDSSQGVTKYDIQYEQTDAGSPQDEGIDPRFIPIQTPRGSASIFGSPNSILYFRGNVSGNYLNAYGGLIRYSLVSNPAGNEDNGILFGPEIIIEGADLAPSTRRIRLIHSSVLQLDGDNRMIISLPLIEDNFLAESSMSGLVPATRDQLMIALKSLKAIYIRAAYWTRTIEPKLEQFDFQTGSERTPFSGESERALSVERCQCPPNYRGASCEECAPGYYRTHAGPFGGYCIPCECNEHSETCDSLTGTCSNCRHNTTGAHCEKCQIGFHGNATQQTPHDCLICACPLPYASNNFADSCEFSPDGREISCSCREGYYGPRCESCQPGYYGNPSILGEICRPCECSGNIDTTDALACDTVTGRCVRCLNNTGGETCNLCARGYFGDAIHAKDCRSCSCERCGVEECQSYNGDCHCLPNVVGSNCDRCRPDHYGLTQNCGRGCKFCDCSSIGSLTTQCDGETGQCPCKPGVSERRCDQCSPGFWNYTPDGCQPCSCNQQFSIGVGCNPEDGQCTCLPGVIGANCSHCPYRWVLIKDRGCQSCDSCQHQLLDNTDEMARVLDPVKKEFDEVAVSYFTTQRLVYFNETAEILEPGVALLNPSKEDLRPYVEAFTALETDSKTQRQKAEVTNESLKDKAKQSIKLKDKSMEVESKVQEAVVRARTAVFETKDLMEGFTGRDKKTSPQTEASLAEARAIIDVMKKVTFSPIETSTENGTAAFVHQQVKEFIKPIGELTGELKAKSEDVIQIKDKLKDIRNESDYSLTTSYKADEIAGKIRDAKFANKVQLLEGITTDMSVKAENTTSVNKNTTRVLDKLKHSYNDLEGLKMKVNDQKEPLEQTSNTLKNELDAHRDTIRKSNEHVRNLKYQADRLDEDFDASRVASEQAVGAATAYQKISDAINEAYTKAQLTAVNTQNATQISNGIGESAARAMEPSRNLLKTAAQSVDEVENDLKRPLEDYKKAIEDVKIVTGETKSKLEKIQEDLNKLKKPGDFAELENSIQVSESARSKSQEAIDDVDDVLRNLPNDQANSKLLPLTVSDLNKGIQVAESQLNEAKESIPISSSITEELEAKQPFFDDKRAQLATDIAELKAKIRTARELANRVPVGMNFVESSSLHVANPQSLESQQVESKVSVFFKTKDPGGLILFMGNEPGRKAENDYMAIEVKQGYPVLTVDLGSGAQSYMINEKYVADDRWYKASVERSGRSIQFTITDEVDGREVPYIRKDSYSVGTKSLFNVDKNATRIYVGGFPKTGTFPNPVRQSNFRGSIEDLTIGDEKVGLWNFKDAQNVAPALGRDSLIDLTPKQGLRFLGNGYAVLSRTRFPFVYRSAIRMKFQTTAKNGLMFLVGKGRKFTSLEVVNGYISFKYDLGNGIANLTTPEPYNDGRWHTLNAVRDNARGILAIDNRNRAQGQSPPGQMAVSDYMYFGGYPGKHAFTAVTNQEFEGCLDEVQIDDDSVDLTTAVDTRDTMSGCPSSQVGLIASFFGDGFLKVDSGTEPSETPPVSHPKDDVFEINFRFKTNESDGLIFYGADGNQDNYLSVSLADGSLHVRTNPGESKINTGPLNDASWHVVTVTRDRNTLFVNVDDTAEYDQGAPGGPLSLSSPGSLLLFGGRPENYHLKRDAAESNTAYRGCLGDINVNGKRVDFTASERVGSAITRNCQNDEQGIDLPNTFSISPVDDEIDEITQPPLSLPHEASTTSVVPTTTTTTSTPTPITTTRRPKLPEPNPTPYEKCRLPYRTRLPLDDEVSLDDGVQFGNFERTSRIEFWERQDDGTNSEYSVEFRTLYPDGVLLMKTNIDSIDFIAVYIRNGSICYGFDSGAGPAVLTSPKAYNDGLWHTVMVDRVRNTGTLTIDGEFIGNLMSAGVTSSINAGTTLFVGGLSSAVWGQRFDTAKKIGNISVPFKGCLRNLSIRRRHPGDPSLTNSIEPCTDATEPGFAFYPNSGFMKVSDRFKVGRRIGINLQIKPRSPSGILLAVHGETDFMILQMVNGTIKFTVDNGRAPLSSSFSTQQPYDLCDGRWHFIQVSKQKNIVTLAVDELFGSPGIGPGGLEATDTDHPLYWGGHPNPYGKPGLETTEQFVGCMRNLNINFGQSKPAPLKFNYEAIQGNVGLHACPSN